MMQTGLTRLEAVPHGDRKVCHFLLFSARKVGRDPANHNAIARSWARTPCPCTCTCTYTCTALPIVQENVAMTGTRTPALALKDGPVKL